MRSGVCARVGAARVAVCVDVRSRHMMIRLTGVSRADLTVPGLQNAHRLSCCSQTKLAAPNEAGGQGAVTLTGRLTHENESGAGGRGSLTAVRG